MATTYQVFTPANVTVSPSGYNATPKGTPERASIADFDDAYQAAVEAGGDRWVISTNGSSEYVEVAS